MTYNPKPIDTSKTVLTDSQSALIELLAENVHDVWAQKRFSEGWTYGAKRDDDAKTHPSLAPFGELSRTEQDYDRVMIEQVVKAAIELGYKIERPPEE
ncbi:MAG: RyR domain-containing protein [Neomegalonema sp.]|nr:RyR domain-containing protein [Neomegalonema sp.]